MTDSTVEPTEVEEPVGGQEQVEEKPAGAEPEAEKPDIDWKSMSRKHEDRAKAVSAELEVLKAELSEASKGAGRVSELEAAVSAAEKRAERAELAAEVAVAKGVKLRYLTGDSREELEASADEWLNDAKSIGRVGVVPTQGTGDVAPRASSYEAGAQRAREKHSKQKGEAA